ncbi:DUF4817 domain-containing protein [Nephila pilipes]|uniref:DUF4817 domain-containing protein n=1 Tax=Nephila pilipes TaxID=299642 RepID=A0A8X6MZX1_NEPPI|nr:DUF4817 domain-containing protein [Nephila pilipes]
MNTPQEKTQTLLRFIETKSIMQTQRNYRRVCQKDPPSRNRTLRWKKNFLETGNIVDKKRSGHPYTNNDHIERVRETFLINPRRSER